MTETARPTGRRLRADARRNRDLVLSTAREMLAVDGLSVSFDEIARRAGVGVGTVYRHFPNRESLFEAVILGRVEQFVERAQTLAHDTEPRAAFIEYFTHVVGQISLNQALCDALEADTGAGFVAPDHVQAEFRDAFDTLLRRAQLAHAVRPDVDVADVLDLIVACATAERRARQRNAPDRLVALVLDGLRPQPR